MLTLNRWSVLAALETFLRTGGCSCDGWESDALSQLGSELRKGEATLGYDSEGMVKRVVSVAKPVRVSETICLALNVSQAFALRWRLAGSETVEGLEGFARVH